MPKKPTYRDLERRVAELEAQPRSVRDDSGRITESPAAANDITERKWAEREMARLASFPVLNPSPIVEADWDGQVLFANPSAQKLFPDIQLGKGGMRLAASAPESSAILACSASDCIHDDSDLQHLSQASFDCICSGLRFHCMVFSTKGTV
jgi:hypothetical protein